MIRVKSCNYFLQNITIGLISNFFNIHWIHDVKKIYKFVKFIVDIHNLLKFFFLLLLSENTNLSIGGLWVVRLLSHQCHTNLSVWTIYNVSHLLNKLQLLLHVFGSVDWSTAVKFWSLISVLQQLVDFFSKKLIEINFSHCKFCHSRNCAFLFSLLNTLSLLSK